MKVEEGVEHSINIYLLSMCKHSSLLPYRKSYKGNKAVMRGNGA